VLGGMWDERVRRHLWRREVACFRLNLQPLSFQVVLGPLPAGPSHAGPEQISSRVFNPSADPWRRHLNPLHQNQGTLPFTSPRSAWMRVNGLVPFQHISKTIGRICLSLVAERVTPPLG
jgi:hypothetical protein